MSVGVHSFNIQLYLIKSCGNIHALVGNQYKNTIESTNTHSDV